MKNVLICILALSAGLAACRQQADGEFTIEGRVGKWNAPAKVYFSYFAEDGERVDSAVMKRGAFTFNGITEWPALVRLIADYTGEGPGKAFRDGNFLLLYVDGGTIEVRGDSLHKAVITGSPVNDEYVTYLEWIGGQPQVLSARMNARLAAASDEERNEPGFRERMDEEYRLLREERAAKQREWAREHPSSYFSVIALSEAAGVKADPKVIEPLLLALDEQLQKSPEGIALAQRIEAARTIGLGRPAPDFTQTTADGRQVSLSDYRGRYVLLDFWASWCGPCRAESPWLVRAIESYGDKGFDVLGVSLDKEADRNAWIKAMQDDGYTWTNVSDLKGWDNAAARLYGIRAIPQNYLIDPQGIIIEENLRGEKLIEALAKLFE